MRKFGLLDKVAYLCGDLANDFSFIFVAMYLMIFYTNVLGISPAIIGTLFLTARIVDAFTDVGMGRILDTMKPRAEGKFRYWIRVVAPYICLSSFLLFVYVVKDFPEPIKIVYIFVTYIVWGSFCYTAVNIPYGSMASVISEKAEDRASLSIFRTLGANIAIFIISYIVPKYGFVNKVIDGKEVTIIVPQNFTIIAAIFSVCAFGFYMFCYKFSIERVRTVVNQPENNASVFTEIKRLAKSLATNKSLRSFILIAIILLLTTMLGQGLSPYLYKEYFASPKYLAYHGMIGTIVTIILSFFAGFIVKIFGKQITGAAGLIFGGMVYIVLTILKLNDVKMFFIIYTISVFGVNLFNIIIWSFISDIIDDQEVREGKREDGTIYAIYSFSRKIGQALAGGLTGFVLTAIGYVSSNDPSYIQADSVKNAIYSLFTTSSAVGYLLCGLLLLLVYPLTKEKVEKNTETIMSRREK